MISSQTIYGLHGLNDDIEGKRRAVTIRDNKQQTEEDSATQLMRAGRLSFAICLIKFIQSARKSVPKLKEKVTWSNKSVEIVQIFLRY